MSNTETINARMDKATKTRAVSILHSLGLSTTEAIYLYFKQIIFTRSIPFEIKIPNKTTLNTFKKVDAGKELHRVSGVDELMKELKE